MRAFVPFASVALRQSAASSPELSSPGSVRCVLSSQFASRSSVLRKPQSPVAQGVEFGSELRSGVLRKPELPPELSVASRPHVLRPSVLRSLRASPSPHGVSELRQASSSNPKVIVAPALNSIREAARASKVARIAERLALIAGRCR